MEGRKSENWEKKPQSKDRTNNKLNSHGAESEIQIWDTLVAALTTTHATPAPQLIKYTPLSVSSTFNVPLSAKNSPFSYSKD